KYFDKSGNVVSDTKVKSKQEVKFHYPDGTVRWEGMLDNGKRTGLWKEYYRNGLLKSELNYKDSKLNGEGKEYYYNGKVRKEMNFSDGKYHGKYREYYRNGQLYKSAWHENGDGYGDIYFYEPDGTLETKYTLMKNKVVGKLYNYNVEGNVSSIERYDDDLFIGFTLISSEGKEIQNIDINQEKIDIEYKGETGEIRMVRNYTNGAKNGISNGYYLNKKLSSEGQYLDDKREGLWKYYNPDNTLNVIQTLESGKPT